MKLEKILKVTGSVILTGVIVYKIVEEYSVRKFESDMNEYLEKVREGL